MKNYFFNIILLFSIYISQAQIVNIPDPNFKNALVNTNCVDTNGDNTLDGDVDSNNDGEIQVSEAEEVLGMLYIPAQNISTLEGIESFINIEELACHYNNLINLDLTQNSNLKKLYCSNNQLINLDVSQNQNLEVLNCVDNELNELYITQNQDIYWLECTNNQLTSLDLTQNLNLRIFSCFGNQLTNLDVSQNTELQIIICKNNLLTSLDVSQNPNLIDLKCENNLLSNLNIKNGNNSILHDMWTFNNTNLTCIQVDDVNFANSQICDEINNDGWCKDEWAEYSENCILGITDFNIFSLKIYPNPVENILNISSEFQIDNVKIYSLQGQLIHESKNSQIDVSLLSPGIYFASIIIDGKNNIKKFIKE